MDKAPSAESFLTFAQQYQRAGATLLAHREEMAAPLYFNYCHALELAFKAYLGSHGLPTPRVHDLSALLDDCQRGGLQTRSDLREVVRLLKDENDEHGFRYFLPRGTGRPEITWLREVVDEVMGVVDDEVQKRPTKPPKAGFFKLAAGKPEPK